jgi:NADPH:quinone reductase-like Zn-dependent oxidoreductase
MGSFSKDAIFAAFDFSTLCEKKPKTADELLSDVMRLFRAGAIKGPLPLVKYGISDMDMALQAMHSEQIVGKVVLTADDDSMIKVCTYKLRDDGEIGLTTSQATPQDKSGELLRPDVSYLLVGGLGGIGRATAMWMVSHGVRNIVFANRTGHTKQEAKDTIQALEGKGATVKVYSCDVSDASQVSDMIAKASKDMPPIRGVIQAAMVLRVCMNPRRCVGTLLTWFTGHND